MQTATQRRLPAEWEATDAVLMAWPHEDTDWLYVLEEARRNFTAIAEAIAPYARVMMVGPDLGEMQDALCRIPENRKLIVPVETNDTWTRDYGVITVADADGTALPLDFKFNGWGLKFAADRDNLVSSRLAALGIFRREPENRMGFVLEGGAIDSDGAGTILTTDSCLLNPNRNGGMDRQGILDEIARALGAERVISLRHGHLEGDDTDGHIDTLARFAPPGDVIFYTGCADPRDAHYEDLKAMRDELAALRTAYGRPYHLLELPLPDPIYDSDGRRLPATYANFLIVNGAVLLPVYGQPLKDKMAADIIAAAMPDYAVVPVDCRTLILQHGSLHCSTMQLPPGTLAI